MSRKTQMIVLAVLLGLAALIWIGNWRSSGSLTGVFVATGNVERFVVPNPSLRLDLLAEIQRLDYTGMKRNIFNAAPLPPQTQANVPAPKVEIMGPAPAPAPPEDPPLVPPFKFYGYVVDARSGRRRGFFTNGDDIWVAAEGDLVQRRFKLVRLSNTRAEVEEIATKKRATLPLDESAAPSGG